MTPEQERYWWNLPTWVKDRFDISEKALRDIKSQALVADRAWLLSRADLALRRIRS